MNQEVRLIIVERTITHWKYSSSMKERAVQTEMPPQHSHTSSIMSSPMNNKQLSKEENVSFARNRDTSIDNV